MTKKALITVKSAGLADPLSVHFAANGVVEDVQDKYAYEAKKLIKSLYVHKSCGTINALPDWMAKLMHKEPRYFSALKCVKCKRHSLIHNFKWLKGGNDVGT